MSSQTGLSPELGLELREAVSEGTFGEAALPGGLRIDEVLGLGEGTEFEPLVDGNEASRSTQSFATLASVTVPADRYGLLDEVSANIDSNGEVRFAIPGEDTFSFTGSIDVALPLNGAILLPGSTVELLHQSTDGNSSTQRGLISARVV